MSWKWMRVVNQPYDHYHDQGKHNRERDHQVIAVAGNVHYQGANKEDSASTNVFKRKKRIPPVAKSIALKKISSASVCSHLLAGVRLEALITSYIFCLYWRRHWLCRPSDYPPGVSASSFPLYGLIILRSRIML